MIDPAPAYAQPPRKLVLASASPRRKSLLTRLGCAPDAVTASDIDETPRSDERPRDYALRMGREKAEACAVEGAYILAGDTVVAAGRRILPKAETRDEADRCLSILSGRRHDVFSSVVLRHPDGTMRHKISVTCVQFKRLSDAERTAYLATDEWRGKAGGYAIQGAAEGLIRTIRGSHSGVMGLPLYEARILLKSAGFPIG
ncbi:MAG: Maf family nucleotide pyrophosphatase [Pontixanthobacter sp.]